MERQKLMIMDREAIKKIRESVTTIVEWDFAQVKDFTVLEMCYSLLDKTVEACTLLKENTAIDGVEWIIAAPELASIFEVCAYNFVPYKPTEIDLEDEIGQRIFRKPNTRQTDLLIEHIGSEAFGSEVLSFKGVVDSRWRLFTDILAPADEILVGIIPAEEKVVLEVDPRCFAKILVKNFINFGDLDYSSSEECNIEPTLRYDGIEEPKEE